MFSEKLTDVIGKIQKVAGPNFIVRFNTVSGKNIFNVRLYPKSKIPNNKEVKIKLSKIQKIIDNAGFTNREIKLSEVIKLCNDDVSVSTCSFGFRTSMINYFNFGEYIARKIKGCRIEVNVGTLPVLLEDELDVEMTVEGITEFLQYLGGGKVESEEIANFLNLAGY